MTRARQLTVAAFVAYLIGLARVTLWPQLGAEEGFDAVRSVLAWLGTHGIPLSYSATEFVANIALFVPFGLLVALLAPRWPSWVVVAAGSVTSTCIELAQLLFLPDRVADVRDVVANTLGTALGLAALIGWNHARAAAGARTPPAEPEPASAPASDEPARDAAG